MHQHSSGLMLSAYDHHHNAGPDMVDAQETTLSSWEELSSLSDEELFNVFHRSPHRYPSPSMLNPVEVRRIAVDAVMRIGPLEDSEVQTMRLVSAASTVLVPAVLKVIERRGTKAIVMQYITGRTLKECWPGLSLWRRFRVIWTLRDYIRQLRRIKSPGLFASRSPPFPGPLANEPQTCDGPMFTDYGAGPFASYAELTAWFTHKLEVNRRVTKYPPGPMTFDSSMPLVLSHLDLHPRNILVDDNHRVWLIDWEFAGFYPQWFEYAAMRGTWGDILAGRWERWVLGFIAGFYEHQLRFIGSIGWALTTGAFAV